MCILQAYYVIDLNKLVLCLISEQICETECL